MKSQALILAVASAGGLILGWFTAPAPRVAASIEQPPPNARDAARVAGEARARLLASGLGVPRVEEGPPPPDISEIFRRDLTAIEDADGRRVVWIVDPTQIYGRRALRVGDLYQDGWRVVSIGAQTIELRRREEGRSIAVFGSTLASQP